MNYTIKLQIQVLLVINHKYVIEPIPGGDWLMFKDAENYNVHTAVRERCYTIYNYCKMLLNFLFGYVLLSLSHFWRTILVTFCQ